MSDRPASRAPVLYLHGFASSPDSTKARDFGARLAARGVAFVCPDFNEPDFRTLTTTRMLDQLGRALDRVGGRATLMGSSLGGALAVLGAARYGNAVERLVLMAPAVTFARPGHHLLSQDRIDEWRARGAQTFFHYAYGEARLLDYAFHEDSLLHDPLAVSFAQPTLVFQGMRDAVVDARSVEHFAAERSNVTLSLLDDDHQLIASLPRMWTGIEDFLGLVE